MVVSGMVSGVCGSLNGSGVYDANNSGDSVTGGSLGLCAYGTATGFVYNTGTHSWSWSCTGSNGGSGMSCSASELYCGDGVTQGSNGEQCDGQSGCNASCTYDSPVCHGLTGLRRPNASTQVYTLMISALM